MNNITKPSVNDQDTSSKIKNQTISDVDYQSHPLIPNDAKTNDIIAFKMLNFGKDYSPQVSKTITAKVISFSPQTNTFNLKIIKGLDEVHFDEVPLGKFSIPKGEEDEKNTSITDTVNINYSKMIEPCFVTKSSDSHSNLLN